MVQVFLIGVGAELCRTVTDWTPLLFRVLLLLLFVPVGTTWGQCILRYKDLALYWLHPWCKITEDGHNRNQQSDSRKLVVDAESWSGILHKEIVCLQETWQQEHLPLLQTNSVLSLTRGTFGKITLFTVESFFRPSMNHFTNSSYTSCIIYI